MKSLKAMTLVTMKYVDNVVSGILRIYGKKSSIYFPLYPQCPQLQFLEKFSPHLFFGTLF